jgi:hypothetical protein
MRSEQAFAVVADACFFDLPVSGAYSGTFSVGSKAGFLPLFNQLCYLKNASTRKKHPVFASGRDSRISDQHHL